MLLKSYYYSFNLPIIIVRCSDIYGPKQYPINLIPTFINNLLNGDKCYIYGDGNKVRNYIYIDDAIDALILINEKGEENNIYYISTDFSISMNELAKLLIKNINNTTEYSNNIEYISNKNFNDFICIKNSSKLQKMGWECKINFEEGIKKTIQSIKELMIKNN